MQTVQLNLDRGQLVSVLQAMSYPDKVDIYAELKKELFVNRYDKLLKSLRTDELSLEDITEAVDDVRQNRYEKAMQRK